MSFTFNNMTELMIDYSNDGIKIACAVCNHKCVIIFDFVSFVYGFSNSGKRLSEFIKIINIANIDGTVLFVIDWFLNSKTNIAVRIQVNQF